MDEWLERHPGRKKTRRFIITWLNKVERPVGAPHRTLSCTKRVQRPGDRFLRACGEAAVPHHPKSLCAIHLAQWQAQSPQEDTHGDNCPATATA